MICPYLINISVLVGAILSWGVMWPLIKARKGDWYAADLSDSNLRGVQGYRVLSHIPYVTIRVFKTEIIKWLKKLAYHIFLIIVM